MTKEQQKGNLVMKLALKCAQCCMWCLQKTVEFVSYCSWLEMPSALSEDTAPSARLVASRAQAAHTHPRAQPEQPGGSPWHPEFASGCPKVEFSPLNHQVLRLRLRRHRGLLLLLGVQADLRPPHHAARAGAHLPLSSRPELALSSP